MNDASWQTEVTIKFDERQALSEEQLASLLPEAGERSWGRFQIEDQDG